jgi:hypothetical protein
MRGDQKKSLPTVKAARGLRFQRTMSQNTTEISRMQAFAAPSIAAGVSPSGALASRAFEMKTEKTTCA